jgi:hypothetical protein
MLTSSVEEHPGDPQVRQHSRTDMPCALTEFIEAATGGTSVVTYRRAA